jgi:uncharacterized membrane protein
MQKQMKETFKLPETLLLGIMSVFCLMLSLARCLATHSGYYLSLNWNLFLAFVPWAVTSFIVLNPSLTDRKLILMVLLAIWLVFFPNAPYILTDLFHLREKTNVPVWFDFILIFSFAWTGLMFGFISLMEIETILEKFMKRPLVNISIVILLFIGSYGIYLGRYLRWNSWDIVQEPKELAKDIAGQLLSPANHPRTWIMTILFGILLNFMYWSLKLIVHKNKGETRLLTKQ